ncbi:HAD family hydrolase [Thiomicrorhabdus xiamenensis]|uniref:HAD family hydrolase n=1 Tax=Thiomicrorhabdus xiamenensis TaxID=2739063 RepID=A0A7D4NPM5_9GAMM|nr:HAD family hydrolase [Thiomicrorhabdus xiamenensis]QKI89753.1 HAD family hydrolase [Thiomicrorhabdus xiamenensis]
MSQENASSVAELSKDRKGLVLFDFDGTLTTKDSLPDFIQFACGRWRYYWGLLCLSPWLSLYVLKLMPNDKAKEKLLGHFFRGWDEARFNALAERYSLSRIEPLLRPKAKLAIERYQQKGAKIVVISASLRNWLEPWCEQKGFELIATEFAVENGVLSGKFDGNNCYGQEKVRRIKQRYVLDEFDFVHAYGDSSGDKPMLALADKGYYRVFE